MTAALPLDSPTGILQKATSQSDRVAGAALSATVQPSAAETQKLAPDVLNSSALSSVNPSPSLLTTPSVPHIPTKSTGQKVRLKRVKKNSLGHDIKKKKIKKLLTENNLMKQPQSCIVTSEDSNSSMSSSSFHLHTAATSIPKPAISDGMSLSSKLSQNASGTPLTGPENVSSSVQFLPNTTDINQQGMSVRRSVSKLSPVTDSPSVKSQTVHKIPDSGLNSE